MISTYNQLLPSNPEGEIIREYFTQTSQPLGIWKTYVIVHSVCFFFAIYLSFKCNPRKFSFESFIIAFFFPIPYIIYIFATKHGFCNIDPETLTP